MQLFVSVVLAAICALLAPHARAAELSAVVQKPSADVHAEAKLDSPKIATLQRDSEVKVSAQQGLWYQLRMTAEKVGYVRVNDLRIAYAGTENSDADLRVLTQGKAGSGRVTETAGVRGIDESDLKSAALDQAQLTAMIGNRVADPAAAAYAKEQSWQATSVAYDAEAKPGNPSAAQADAGKTKPSKSAVASAVGGVLGSFGVNVGSKVDTAVKVAPKSEADLAAEELALGPEIAGRVLGARPLWTDASAQQRVNVIGRWVATQTSRPDLPWTFGVIDTPEINAFASPGGYVLVTRGMYEILASDSEIAAVLGHEISHCVQRDHYNVIRKQELASVGKDVALSEVSVPGQSPAAAYAKRYAEQHGATILLTALDRDAEFRADKAAEIYLARAGMNPLALYSVLQKMTAVGQKSASLAELYKTHPPLDERMDRIDRRGYAELAAFIDRE